MKNYELSNHLGNVLAVITDEKLWSDSGYIASVVSASDYEPFGLALEGRSLQVDKYRWGFNGKEDDGDFGEGLVDFGARVYNRVIGRWMACDPLERKYPSISTYAFAGNMPIIAVDL